MAKDFEYYSRSPSNIPSSIDDTNVSAKLIMKLTTDKAILKQALRHAQEKCERYYCKGLAASQTSKSRPRSIHEKENSKQNGRLGNDVSRCLAFLCERMKTDPNYNALYSRHIRDSATIEQLLDDEDYLALLSIVLPLLADLLQMKNLANKHSKKEIESLTESMFEDQREISIHTSTRVPEIASDRSSFLDISMEHKPDVGNKSLLTIGLSETKSLLEALTTQNDRLVKLNQQISESIGRTSNPRQADGLSRPMKPKSISCCFSDLPSSINLETSLDTKPDFTLTSGLRSKNSVECDLGKLLDDTVFAEYIRNQEASASRLIKPSCERDRRRHSDRYMDQKAMNPLVQRPTSKNDMVKGRDCTDYVVN